MGVSDSRRKNASLRARRILSTGGSILYRYSRWFIGIEISAAVLTRCVCTSGWFVPRSERMVARVNVELQQLVILFTLALSGSQQRPTPQP